MRIPKLFSLIRNLNENNSYFCDKTTFDWSENSGFEIGNSWNNHVVNKQMTKLKLPHDSFKLRILSLNNPDSSSSSHSLCLLIKPTKHSMLYLKFRWKIFVHTAHYYTPQNLKTVKSFFRIISDDWSPWSWPFLSRAQFTWFSLSTK